MLPPRPSPPATRHTYLTSSPSSAHIVPHGLHADISLTGGFAYPAAPTDGVVANVATLLAFAEVESDASASAAAVFTLYEADGVTVAATAASKPAALSPAAPTATLSALLSLRGAQAWSVARPYLYTLSAVLGAGGHTVNVSVGLRAVRFDADEGVFINEQRARFRAFCDHESFAVV
jgi:beta-galactosidase/beta-glucuronidase